MKILKKISVVLVAIILLLIFLFVALGIFLPDEEIAKNKIEIEATPEKVWAVVTTPEKYPEWAPNLKKVEIINANSWKEIIEGNDQPVIFTIVKNRIPDDLEIKFEMEGFMSGEWRGSVEKTDNGVVLMTEDKIIHKTWIGKILMSLFFDIEEFSRSWNAALKKQAEKIEN